MQAVSWTVQRYTPCMAARYMGACTIMEHARICACMHMCTAMYMFTVILLFTCKDAVYMYVIVHMLHVLLYMYITYYCTCTHVYLCMHVHICNVYICTARAQVLVNTMGSYQHSGATES